jgi:hypothetical protein
MRIKNVKLELTGKNLIGFDFKSEKEYLGVTKFNEIITPFQNFELNIDFKFPIIRILNKEQFLLINTRTENDKENCFVYNNEGRLMNKFNIGVGIADIIILKNKIIVSYFDEGVLGNDGPNNNGLSIFNLSGKLIFGYNEKQGQLIIVDCYCISELDNQRILFLAYPDFNLIELDLANYKETVYEIPLNLIGSNAMTTFKNKIYFHSPYKDKEGIYEWEIGKEITNKIGNYKGNLRGIQNGKFLCFKNKEYTIIEMD